MLVGVIDALYALSDPVYISDVTLPFVTVISDDSKPLTYSLNDTVIGIEEVSVAGDSVEDIVTVGLLSDELTNKLQSSVPVKFWLLVTIICHVPFNDSPANALRILLALYGPKYGLSPLAILFIASSSKMVRYVSPFNDPAPYCNDVPDGDNRLTLIYSYAW